MNQIEEQQAEITRLENINSFNIERIKRQHKLIVDLAEWIDSTGKATAEDVPLLRRVIEEIQDDRFGD
jgi:hypothetical protein